MKSHAGDGSLPVVPKSGPTEHISGFLGAQRKLGSALRVWNPAWTPRTLEGTVQGSPRLPELDEAPTAAGLGPSGPRHSRVSMQTFRPEFLNC